jgi:nucleoside 2-deoxyribosyltransferase
MSKPSNGSVYLSGGMEFAKNLGGDWRRECSTQLNQLGFLPLDITQLDQSYSAAHGDIFRSSDDVDLLQRKINIRKHFVDTDLKLIEHDSDALIVLLDESVQKGSGTTSECQFAYLHDIPIFIVNALPETERVSGWLFALSTKMFNNFDELYAYLGTLPPGILIKDRFGNRRSGMHYLCSLCGTSEEKHKAHFVSKVTPMYCKHCVELVKHTYDSYKDRYEFFQESITKIN